MASDRARGLPAVTNEQERSEGRPCQSLYLAKLSPSGPFRRFRAPPPFGHFHSAARSPSASDDSDTTRQLGSICPAFRKVRSDRQKAPVSFQPPCDCIKALAFLSIPPLHALSSRTFFRTMYPLGFLPFFCSLVSHDAAVHAALLVPLVVLAIWFYTVALRPPPSKCEDDVRPVHLPGSSLSHILPFFHRRFDFINQGFELAGQAIYQFSLLRVSVLLAAPRNPPCPVRPDCQGLGLGFGSVSG